MTKGCRRFVAGDSLRPHMMINAVKMLGMTGQIEGAFVTNGKLKINELTAVRRVEKWKGGTEAP